MYIIENQISGEKKPLLLAKKQQKPTISSNSNDKKNRKGLVTSIRNVERHNPKVKTKSTQAAYTIGE